MKNKVLLHYFIHFLLFILPFIFYQEGVLAQDVRKKGKRRQTPEQPVNQTNAQITPQNISISGKVIDAQTSEPLPGVKISLKEKPEIGTLSDLNGQFLLKDLSPQNYTLTLQYIGYQPKEIQDISPQNASNLTVTLQETGVEMQEVVIQSTVRKESEIAAILLQQLNPNIMDVYSGDLILKTSTDLFVNTALSRMPGISIVEDRYLICRGMPERYNSILFNGSLMPVLAIDKQTFDFNNLPSNILSQIQLVKSYSTDLPGGFGGGIIGFETAGMPEQNLTLFNYQFTYNPLISFKKGYLPQTTSNNGKMGLFSSVQPFLPNDFPDAYTIQNIPTHSDENASFAKQVNATFAAIPQTLRPNQSLAFQLQRKISFNEQQNFGFTLATNFSENNAIENTQFKFFEDYDPDLGFNPVSDSGDLIIYKNTQTLNQILNLNFVSKKMQIHLKNFFSFNQWSNFSNHEGDYHYIDTASSIDRWYHYMYWYSRVEKQSLLSSQLSWEWLMHQNNTSHSKLFTRIFFNQSQYSTPLNYPLYSEIDDSTQQFRMTSEYLDNFYDMIFLSNSLQKQKDLMYGSNIQWNYQRKLRNNHLFNFSAGLFILQQKRNFNSRIIGLVPSIIDSSLLDLNQFPINPYYFEFPTDEIKPYHFVLKDITTDFHNYSAVAFNAAPFILASYTTNKWFFQAGMRYENYRLDLTNQFLDGTDTALVKENRKDFLFNANISYSLNETMKLKTTYSSTLVRPDLKERSAVEYFDYYQSIFWAGNPQLHPTKIHNIDLRYEWFRKGTNLLSFTLFYKNILTPIEQMLRQGELVYVTIFELNNAKKAYNLGFEIEARQQLAEQGYLKNFKIYTNLMVQRSQVSDDRTGTTNRPLQGQSPYLLNIGILLKEPKSNIELDLFYNHFGKQIVIVGSPGKFDNLYLLPRHRIDIQVSRTFEKFSLKFAVQDIFNQPYIRRQYYGSGFYQDNKTTRLSRLFTLALQYRF